MSKDERQKPSKMETTESRKISHRRAIPSCLLLLRLLRRLLLCKLDPFQDSIVYKGVVAVF